MSEVHSIAASIHVDIDQMRGLVEIAIRRASAFARLGLDGLPDRGHGDFNLDASLSYQFWPIEINEHIRNEIRDEFAAWIVGSCLRELDLFYGLFLDRIWFAIEASEVHGRKVRSDFEFDRKFSRQTNVAKKQKEISFKLSIDDYFFEMNSLSLARNALAHNAGLVRAPTDCNNEDRSKLCVNWLAFDMVVSRGGEERIVERTPFDTEELPGEGEVGVALRIAQRCMEIPAGNKISFTRTQLAELCMFYKIIADKTIAGLVEQYRKIGLVQENPDTEAEPGYSPKSSAGLNAI